jgi:beta-lactamase regulating signal transducer with metallopeptidase domain
MTAETGDTPMNTILTLLHWMLNTTARASILAIAVLLLQAGLRGVISARCRYALWLPVLLVLVLPVLPRSRWSVENLFAARMPAHAPVSLPVRVEIGDQGAAAPPVSNVSARDWKEEVACIIWAAGVGLSLGGGLLLYAATLRRFTREAEEPDESLTRMIDSLCGELRLRRSPRVIVSREVESPAVTGLVRPVLLLPADFAGSFAGNEARLVLKHELMHIKRLDLQINALVSLLNAVHWFNPVLWLATWCARQDREAACDAQVLASESRDCRSDYGNVLLKVQTGDYKRWLSIGFVGIFEAGRALRGRVAAVARYRPPGPASGIVAGAAILLLGVLGATHAQNNDAAPATAPGAGATGVRTTKYNRNKLNNIIIPKIDFRDAALTEVVDFLRQKSAELDTNEPDPAQRGVNIVTQLDNIESYKITVSLQNQSLSNVLQAICKSSNLKLRIEPFSVVIVPAVADDHELYTKEYKVPAAFLGPQAGPQQSAMDFLIAKGVQFPPGASAAYFPTSSRLIVHNTDLNMELVDAIVEKADKADGKQASSDPSTSTNSPAPGSIQDKLNGIIIPKFELRDATVPEAVDYLKKQSVENDTKEPDPSRRGVNIVLAGPAPNLPANQAPRITISLTKIPLIEAIKYVAQLANYKCTADGTRIILSPQ